MKYAVIVSKEAQKNLGKLPIVYVKRIQVKIAALVTDPYIGKKLEGRLSDRYSIRVWPYRIIYKILKQKLIIEVIEIKHRQSAYKD